MISSRSDDTFEAEVELKFRSANTTSGKLITVPQQPGGSLGIIRASPIVCFSGIWGHSGMGDIQNEPDILLSVPSIPSQPAGGDPGKKKGYRGNSHSS